MLSKKINISKFKLLKSIYIIYVIKRYIITIRVLINIVLKKVSSKLSHIIDIKKENIKNINKLIPNSFIKAISYIKPVNKAVK